MLEAVMLTKSHRFDGKQVIIKFSAIPLVTTIIDTDDIGVWIKGSAARLDGTPDLFEPAKQALSKIADAISYIPWTHIEYIVTTIDSPSPQ
jgi:hypothetical protein